MADDSKPTITLDDLYGASEQDKTVSPPPPAEPGRLDPGHLVYEETPIITPEVPPETPDTYPQPEKQPVPSPVVFQTATGAGIPDVPQAEASGTPPNPTGIGHGQAKRSGRFFKALIFFTVMIILGMGVSALYRNVVIRLTEGDVEYTGDRRPLPDDSSLQSDDTRDGSGNPDEATESGISPDVISVPGSISVSPTIRPVRIISSTTPDSSWPTFTIEAGSARKPVAGISYSLPAEILPPVCDGASCPSQGTYLPGGTRFTVAYYPRNILTPDFERTTVTDAAGRKFATTVADVAGKPALAFEGSFTGSTTGGYRFTRMKGYMIGISEGRTLEINHFVPAGIAADFETDDGIFEKIVSTLVFTP